MHLFLRRNPRLQISPGDSAFALFDELDEFGDLFCLRQFFLHRFDCLASVVFGAVNQAKGFFDQLNAFRRVIFPFQTNEINAANLGGLPSAIMNGGTSWTIFEQPPVMANRPIRQN